MYDLSIIIPHYNTPYYLKTLLQSVQASSNVQTIVIDDKSDKDLDVLRALKSDPQYKHVTFLDNNTDAKSAGTCRNIGLKHAKGRWLLFADADDFFVEGFYSIIEKYFSSDYDVVFFVPTSVDIDTGQPAKRHLQIEEIVSSYSDNPTPDNELRLRYRLNGPCSKMIKLDFVQKHNISFSEIPVANDAAFSAKVGCSMRSFLASRETIYCITNSSGSITKFISEERYDIRLNEFIERFKFLEKRLDKNEFRKLGLCAAETHLFAVLKYGFGIKKLIKVLMLLRKNKVKIITAKYLNPIYIFRGLRTEMKRFKSNRRFYIRG